MGVSLEKGTIRLRVHGEIAGGRRSKNHSICPQVLQHATLRRHGHPVQGRGDRERRIGFAGVHQAGERHGLKRGDRPLHIPQRTCAFQGSVQGQIGLPFHGTFVSLDTIL